jgi:8-amino-7-oxononanoate synthase
VVADGFCPACGEPALIASYIEVTRIFGGRLIIDDTQALGILGYAPEPSAPYGRGGGGIVPWSGIGGSDVILISSLAKGFGVPVAVLAGSCAMVEHFESRSETRIHSSPPSIAVIRAAEHALALNEERGDTLRLRLAKLVRQFRECLKNAGFSASGNLFPVQTLILHDDFDSPALHSRLLQLGIRTVLRWGRNDNSPRISFIITARHTPSDIDRAVDILEHAAGIKKLKQSWR